MIIGIDAREIQGGTYTGIGRALSAFLDWFAVHGGRDTAVLFTSVPMENPWHSRITVTTVAEHVTLLWDQVTLPRLCRVHRIEVLYSPYYKVPIIASCPVVSTIMDVMYLTFPPYLRSMPFMIRLYYHTMGRLFTLKAGAILTCSRFSADEIKKTFGVSESRLRVIPLGVSEAYTPSADGAGVAEALTRLGISSEYILYCGNFRPHKNIDTLLRAFGAIHTTHPDIQLILAGRSDEYASALRGRIETMPCASKVTFTGTVSQEDQRALYRGTRVLCMPSLHEGFGYPALEAMACGAPVVCSNAASLPEVVGTAGILFDPLDSDACAAAVARVLDEPAVAQEMRRKGLEQARRFSGDQYGEQVYSVLRECIKGRRGVVPERRS